MTAPPGEHERFAIIRVSGGAVPDGAVFHGSWPEVMEHIPSSKVIKQKLKIINDAAHAEGRLQSISDREVAVRKAEAQRKADDAENDHALQEMGRRVTELEMQAAKLAPILQQFQQFQTQQQQNDMPPPPGEAMADDGDLETPNAPTTNKADPNVDDARGEFLRLDEPEFPGPELPHPPVVKQPFAAGLDKE